MSKLIKEFYGNIIKKHKSINLLSMADGVNNVLNVPNQRWTNWNERLLPSGGCRRRLKTIGKSAFEGDGKLKKIDIKSTALKSVKKNARKGIHAKCKIHTPGKKWNAYRRILKNKGQKS